MYDFHGGCDLVLLENPEFMNGLGMTVHIRTKIETWWSYVESAVLKIGEETMEIQQDQFHVNGQPVELGEDWIVGHFSGLEGHEKRPQRYVFSCLASLVAVVGGEGREDKM